MERTDAWYTLPCGFKARYTECGDEIYWHLYYKGVRVNGGLCEDFEWAQMYATRYAWLHHLNIQGGESEEKALLTELVNRQLERYA